MTAGTLEERLAQARADLAAFLAGQQRQTAAVIAQSRAALAQDCTLPTPDLVPLESTDVNVDIRAAISAGSNLGADEVALLRSFTPNHAMIDDWARDAQAEVPAAGLSNDGAFAAGMVAFRRELAQAMLGVAYDRVETYPRAAAVAQTIITRWARRRRWPEEDGVPEEFGADAAKSFMQCWWEFNTAAFGAEAPPYWGGQPLHGRTLLIQSDFGLGDFCFEARYIPTLASKFGANVAIETFCPAARLARRIPGVHKVFERPDGLILRPPPPCDAWVLASDLVALVGDQDWWRPQFPYLNADRELVDQWDRRLPPRSEGLRVGLVWACDVRADNHHIRSMPLAALGPLARVPGCLFIGLQRTGSAAMVETDTPPDGGPEAEPTPPEMEGKLLRLGRALTDLADTAAVMQVCDVIVTVDSGPAHLAGALGRPTLLMLSQGARACQSFYWGWHEGVYQTQYPTVNRIRARKHGRWDDVVERVAAELDQLVARRRARGARRDRFAARRRGLR